VSKVAEVGSLAGWRVLVPRPVGQAGELSSLLRAAGAEPVAVPLIAISPPVDLGPLDLTLIDLGCSRFTWVGFTSANAVDAVARRAAELGIDPVLPADTRVAAVGAGTAAALRAAGLHVDLLPTTRGSADALADEWPTARPGDTVLLPRSDIARPGLPDALLAKGYHVETVTAYRTVPQPPPEELNAELRAGRFHAILLTSPSCVTALADALIGSTVVLGAIGRPTATAAAAARRPVDFIADAPTATGLVNGLSAFAVAHPEYQSPPRAPQPIESGTPKRE
jgi:uroporphyrinogen-III synthase